MLPKQGIIIQARLGSTRFPGKILRDFSGGRSILQIQCEKLTGLNETQLIVATTTSEKDDDIEMFCKDHDLLCFRGSENDVLKRFIDCAHKYEFTHVIRVCSDNPFLSGKGVAQLIQLQANSPDSDYIAFKIGDKPSILTHFGLWAEAVRVSALKRIANTTNESFYHEHVTNYIYNNPDLFNITFIDLGSFWESRQQLRFTVDTPEDFMNMAVLYALTSNNDDAEQLVYAAEQSPALLESMKKQIIKNTK
ncbi:MAG: glycosyl transferase family 2 [Bacteroidales bacterium]|nr:glycosyl transferase family 2 [Bacteroidales bacterium]HOY39442.1 glycosyl transferase family 2 [Bacteroidales bacterium]HQP03904.1 glycosyl transferase family 2 [Bacteroidales bacterium]